MHQRRGFTVFRTALKLVGGEGYAAVMFGRDGEPVAYSGMMRGQGQYDRPYTRSAKCGWGQKAIGDLLG